MRWTNIDEPMGKVHVGAAGWLANNTSSWDNPSVNNPAVVEEIPRVIDDWPEESTGKIYRVYSNSSEPVFTGEYQGNRNLMSGATAVYNPDHKAWYAGEYAGYKGAGNAVTIGQTVPKLIQNQDKYDTIGGKIFYQYFLSIIYLICISRCISFYIYGIYF